MIKFHSDEQAGGYINFGLKMTPEKTKQFAKSITRSEMFGSKAARFSAEKTAWVMLLHFGFDDNWIYNKFLPELDKILTEDDN